MSLVRVDLLKYEQRLIRMPCRERASVPFQAPGTRVERHGGRSLQSSAATAYFFVETKGGNGVNDDNEFNALCIFPMASSI